MKNQINQVDISYNGSIVIMGEIDGQSVYWTLTQEQMIKGRMRVCQNKQKEMPLRG